MFQVFVAYYRSWHALQKLRMKLKKGGQNGFPFFILKGSYCTGISRQIKEFTVPGNYGSI